MAFLCPHATHPQGVYSLMARNASVYHTRPHPSSLSYLFNFRYQRVHGFIYLSIYLAMKVYQYLAYVQTSASIFILIGALSATFSLPWMSCFMFSLRNTSARLYVSNMSLDSLRLSRSSKTQPLPLVCREATCPDLVVRWTLCLAVVLYVM